jgi:hypothetical protein
MRDKDLKRLEDDLLVLCLDNCSIYLFADDRAYAADRRPNSEIDKPGKNLNWYRAQLQVGSRTFMRIAKQACAKQFLEEIIVWRYRSYVKRLELTPLGKEIAVRLKSERTGDLPECPEDQLIRICLKIDSPLIQEEPILVFDRDNCLTSLASVTLLQEKSDSKDYIITHNDTTIVTMKREENGTKILVKGVEICYPLYKRIKRMVRITLGNKNLQFAFVPHKLLPRTYLSTTKNLRSVQAKQMLQEWNCFKKSAFS